MADTFVIIYFILGGIIVASAFPLGILSSLLTFTALFQMKEWRIDRLKEHLRREGWFIQLFGKLRPILVMIHFIGVGIYFLRLPLSSIEPSLTMNAEGASGKSTISIFIISSLLGLIQQLQGKQRRPVWTLKAKLIVTGSLLLSFVTAIAMLSIDDARISFAFLPIFIITQPLFVIIAWLLLLPVDTFMKKRVMDNAMKLRASMKDITVIGIAGSVGKTTTKELIKHLLQDLSPIATPAHVNTEMGVAAWLMSVRAQHASPLIVEMGAYLKGEIALLCQIAQPTIGVMTALGSDHLALFGSEEAIVEANAELIESLPQSGHAFLDGLNASASSLALRAHCPVTVTRNPNDVQETPEGLSFSVGDVQHEVALHGKHNIANVLLAMAVAKHLGIADAHIRELLKTFRPLAHTFNVRTEGTVTLLDDTYNLSPLSMKAGIEWAASQLNRPRVLLTSGLQEAGDAEVEHLTVLGKQASDCIERVIFTTTAGVAAFATGYGKQVETLNKDTQRIPEGAVLVALGRMPLSTIQRLLPAATEGRAILG